MFASPGPEFEVRGDRHTILIQNTNTILIHICPSVTRSLTLEFWLINHATKSRHPHLKGRCRWFWSLGNNNNNQDNKKTFKCVNSGFLRGCVDG